MSAKADNRTSKALHFQCRVLTQEVYWLETGRQLDGLGAGSAPHHYGVHSGNYAACHLAPARPGFGLSLDTNFFVEAIKRGGWEINLQKTQ